MQLSGNTVLITGGSSGIGLALAERFLAAGNQVIITGRREGALEEVRRRFPAVITQVSDSGSAADRARLVAELTQRFPDLNVVINNAGIQRKVDLLRSEPWDDTRQEIAINLEGPIHMASLLLPHLLKQARPVLINVSSGLAFVPLTAAPVYSATKAALHSFTLSLRHQLRKTPVTVVEIIPPAVRSNLGGAHDFGVPTDEYADSVIQQLGEGRLEVTYQFSAKSSQASRAEADEMFKQLNGAD
ncbi:SDR family NAD(P)-dependent oxidoreductase [Sorangium sp. So ce136]|uniref:SDR family oxidoreductase n=1 Tax=Sorangium sp. So ce136 TaxID=3133284 RepID=UPI003F025947